MSAGDCPACVASRRAVVDAYFAGYLAGAIEMVASDGACDHLVFCAAHEKMATEVIRQMAHGLMYRVSAQRTSADGGK
jgi:hypothetical protein